MIHGSYIFPKHRRRAFTLVEMLVVISLIVLLLAAAVPAFRYITGSRSLDSAQNLVAAMLNRARAQAVKTRQKMGVAFFRDPKNDKTTMALVSLSSITNQTLIESPGMEQYRQWQADGGLSPSVIYSPGDVVCYMSPVALGSVGAATAGGTQPKRITRLFSCLKATTPVSAAGNAPPDPPTTSNAYWGLVKDTDLDAFSTIDTQVLPDGVGVQLVNDTHGLVTDSYVHFGIILFDGNGHLIYQQFTVQKTSTLGQLAGLSKDLDSGSPNFAPILYTQLGVALYENEQFRTQPNASDGDYITSGYFNTTDPTTFNPDESKEENWLNQNAVILLVDRASGSLAKQE